MPALATRPSGEPAQIFKAHLWPFGVRPPHYNDMIGSRPNSTRDEARGNRRMVETLAKAERARNRFRRRWLTWA